MMKAKIFESNTYNTASACVFRALKDDLRQGAARCVVIVPDKFSLSVESLIHDILGETSNFKCEVMSFLRFAVQSLADEVNRCLTPEGSVMLMRRAATEVADKLAVYGQASKDAQFPREVYAAIASLRNSGIFPEDLLEQEGKLKDIALIYQKYLELLESDLTDSSTRLEAFCDAIPNLNNIENTHIYITDFYQFTQPQFEIIRSLIAHSSEVTVGLVSADISTSRIVPTRARAKLINICEELGVKPQITRVTEELPPWKKQIVGHLFSYAENERVDAQGHIDIFSATDVTSEVERIAVILRDEVFRRGYRFKDFAVVVPDAEQYGREAAKIFPRYGIPFYVDKRLLFSRQPAAKYILAALKTVALGFRYGDVAELIKNPFFYGDADGFACVERFENYILKHSLTKRLRFEIHDELAESVRRKIMDTVSPFVNVKGDNAAHFVRALEEFAENNHILEKCAALATSGEDAEWKASAQIYEKFATLLSEMKTTLAQAKTTAEEFLGIVESVFANIKISLVPMYLDSVFVGEAEESRYDGVKVMFVAGALDGILPRAAADTPVMGLAEEADMISAGLDFFPSKRETVKNNLFALTHLFLKPSERLIVSFPERFRGGEVRPSSVIGRLAAIFSDNGAPLTAKKKGADGCADPKEFATRENGFLKILETATREDKPQDMGIYNAMYSLLDKDKKEKIEQYLAPEGQKPDVPQNMSLERGTFSASMAECYFACPYQAYFRYGLRIKPREEGRLRTLETGTLTHAVMERLINTRAYENPTDENLYNLVRDTFDEVLKRKDFEMFTGRKHANVFKRLQTECVRIAKEISTQIANSDFKPRFSEAKIGFKADGANFEGIRVTVDEKEYTLIGSIDRIDSCDDWFTIIDFKSYPKQLSYSDVYNGTKIQPLLYLAAVSCDDNEGEPAGVLYQPVSVGYKSTADDRFRMKGFVVDDSEVLKRLDKSLKNGERSSYFPVSLNDDGSASGRISTAVSLSVIKSLREYAIRLAENAITEMAQGNIAPSPVADACKYCDVREICPYEGDERYLRRDFPSLSKKSDFAALAVGCDTEVTAKTEGGDGDE